MKKKLTPQEILCQQDIRNLIENDLGKTVWTTVYEDLDTEGQNGSIFCGLISNETVAGSLEYDTWDIKIGESLPGCTISGPHDNRIVRYSRFPSLPDGEPLVLIREFHGVREGYIEVLEEFRLFHNLYYDAPRNTYVKFDENGETTDIIRVTETRVEIRTRSIREFLSMKEAHLAVFFDVVRLSPLEIDDVPVDDRDVQHRDDKTLYTLLVTKDSFHLDPDVKSFSRLLGKKLVPGVEKEKSGIWPYSEEAEKPRFADFIMGHDEDGNPVSHTCNPGVLSNYFGANPGAPHYVTPVFFRRDVLRKYYDEPYFVQDGYLGCGHLWGLRIDNNHEKYVAVLLGDLGRDLSYSEQLYWKSFNIAPEGSISDVAWKRGFMAEPADPTQADLLFKYKFRRFQKAWFEEYGWFLFKPLHGEDEHHYQSLRVPLTSTQREFDEQILSLTKILIDSLNEKKLAEGVTDLADGAKGIDKLHAFLDEKGFTETEDAIGFLRKLQYLRSSGIAHRKSKKYKKAADEYQLDKRGFITVFEDILGHATRLVELMERFFLSK